MKIADLILQLGIKGADGAGKALTSVKKGLTDIASASLEAKAAVLATFYAIERMTTASGLNGRALKNFGDITGLDLGKTQQWIEAARRTGISADETMNAIGGIQKKMADMQLKGEAPAGLQRIAEVNGGLDVERMYKDPFYVLEQVRKYLSTTKDPIGIQNALVESLAPRNFIPTLRSAFDPNSASKGMSDSQIKTLAKQAEAWDMLLYKMTLFRNAISAQVGLPIINALTHAFDLLMRFSRLLSTLSKQFPEFATAAKLAGVALALAMLPVLPQIVAVSAALAGVVFLMSEFDKLLKGNQNNVFSRILATFKELNYEVRSFLGLSVDPNFKPTKQSKEDASIANSVGSKALRLAYSGDGLVGLLADVLRKVSGEELKFLPSLLKSAPLIPSPVPAVRQQPTESKISNTTNNVSPTINIHGVEDAREGASFFTDAIKRTFRQFPQGQGS